MEKNITQTRIVSKKDAAANLLKLSAGEFLYRKGDLAESLYFLLSGQITLLEETEKGEVVEIDRVEVGEPIGELELILGGNRNRFARADTACELSVTAYVDFEVQAQQDVSLMQQVGEFSRRRTAQSQLLKALQTLFGNQASDIFALIEPELEWMQIHDGDWLKEMGGLYIVVTGRLQTVIDGEIKGEIEPGNTIGETTVISGIDDDAHYQAMHDSTVVQISLDLYKRMVDAFPSAYRNLAQIAVSNLRNVIDGQFDEDSLVTIAIVPLNGSQHVQEFCAQLTEAVAPYGEAMHLNSSRVNSFSERSEWSQTDPDNPWSIRLSAWLDQQEANHRFVIYETDNVVNNWTRRAILRAEYVLLVGDYLGDPSITDIERQLLTPKVLETVRRRALVLLYPQANQQPKNTRSWLDRRQLENVHHVRLHKRSDADRIARYMANRSIGLVLGGGGARGFAHMGVLKALEELEIPIDYIGGTSAGGMMAAAHAQGLTAAGIFELLHNTLIKKNPFKSYTIPIMSLINSKVMDETYQDIWGDADISDLWIPYYSIATDISSAKMVVQRTGSVWQAARATQSLPGIVVPLIRDGKMLVDGAVMDNVPVATMSRLNRGPIIAVDVALENELRTDFAYEELPSPWSLLKSRFSPFSKTVKAFTISDIMAQSMVVNSLSRKAEAKEYCDVWLSPDVSDVGLLEITSKATIKLQTAGYEEAMKHCSQLLELVNPAPLQEDCSKRELDRMN